jgi:hypothetical protein
MKQVGIFIYLAVIFSASMAFLPNVTQAATLYLDPAGGFLHRGDSITVSVKLDVDREQNQCINAVDGVIRYSDAIEPVDVSLGNSIFPLWVEPPTINRENRTITFAGGVPNGYCGRVVGDPRVTNTVVDIIFNLPGFSIGGSSDAVATVNFSEETTVYLNDGQGTSLKPRTIGATLDLGSRPGDKMQNSWLEAIRADNIPPSEFSIFLHRDEFAFSGKYYIVFNSTDKQTGIDRYEVMEEPLAQLGSFQWGRADAPWVVARSPYVLKDQTLNSTIRVKAVDKAGNEYIATFIPDASLRTTSGDQILPVILLFVMGVLVLILLAVAFVLIRRRNRAKRAVPDEVEDIELLENNNETHHE